MTRGLRHQYVQPPTNWLDVNALGIKVVKADFIERLVVELLVFSPYVKVSTDDGDNEPVHLAYTWSGKVPAENLDGRVRGVQGGTQRAFKVSFY